MGGVEVKPILIRFPISQISRARVYPDLVRVPRPNPISDVQCHAHVAEKSTVSGAKVSLYWCGSSKEHMEGGATISLEVL